MPDFLEVDVGTSKSLANRALIVKSFYPNLNTQINSTCEDVESLRIALQGLVSGQSEFEFLEGGTSFRFFVARASRLSRKIKISGSKRLLSRPHSDLFSALKVLGVKIWEHPGFIEVQGPWITSSEVDISSEKSTQYASAILLSSIKLENDFTVNLKDLTHSRSYLEMTTSMLEGLGLCRYERKTSRVFFNHLSSDLSKENLLLENDWSSAVSIAALAVFSKQVRLIGLTDSSLQSDQRIVEVFMQMGIKSSFNEGIWTVLPTPSFSGVEIDLSESPDLFPVLATLCAFARGPSYFSGLKNLQFKESHRIAKVSELLRLMGVTFEATDSDFRIVKPTSADQVQSRAAWTFSADSDHRMAMAAGVASLVGARVTIEDQDVVKKSFPSYWEVFRRLK